MFYFPLSLAAIDAQGRTGTGLGGMHSTERLLSLRRAQPAPPLHTRGVLPAERRETAWVLVAGGQQGRCRGVGGVRGDGLIGYGTPTAGRLCAAPISGIGQPGQVALANAP